MIWIVLCGHSSGLKNLNNRLLYSKARSHVCCFILVRFANGSDALNVLYYVYDQNLMFFR
jgi:hypothetical protein